MSRPVTLFTGQWADLTLDDLAEKCGGWGFDGLELACWGDHFDVAQAVGDAGYCAGRSPTSSTPPALPRSVPWRSSTRPSSAALRCSRSCAPTTPT